MRSLRTSTRRAGRASSDDRSARVKQESLRRGSARSEVVRRDSVVGGPGMPAHPQEKQVRRRIGRFIHAGRRPGLQHRYGSASRDGSLGSAPRSTRISGRRSTRLARGLRVWVAPRGLCRLSPLRRCSRTTPRPDSRRCDGAGRHGGRRVATGARSVCRSRTHRRGSCASMTGVPLHRTTGRPKRSPTVWIQAIAQASCLRPPSPRRPCSAFGHAYAPRVVRRRA
jgi:hypothetical protein